MFQISELLGVPLDPEAQASVDSLTRQLQVHDWFVSVQCNPIDRILTVCWNANKVDISVVIATLPLMWEAFRVNGFGGDVPG
jgi:hypothetical protein